MWTSKPQCAASAGLVLPKCPEDCLWPALLGWCANSDQFIVAMLDHGVGVIVHELPSRGVK
eukprot:11998029-Ditylum_brightwellii.AAC.1